MDWTEHLQEQETVRWRGRPAPRCFTFRNWKHSLFGTLLVLLASWWQVTGIQLGAVYDASYLPLIPLPFLVAGLYLAFGHMVRARLEWEKFFFAVTDRRVLLRRGLFRPRFYCLPLDDITYFQLQPHGRHLGTLRIWGGSAEQKMALPCVEHPGAPADLLKEAMYRNGRLAESD